MGVASLVLGIISLLFGIVPLFPVGGPATLLLAALGLPLGVVGLCLGLFSRSDALHTHKELGLHTAGLSIAVVGTLVCLTWVGGLFYAQRKVYHAAALCQKDPRLCPGFAAPAREKKPTTPSP